MEYKTNRPINEDREFFGFIMRTRRRYYDEKILMQEMDPEKDIYRMLKEPKVVIDVGSHIGGTALMAAKRGSIVFAFEPEESNYETLQYNVKINGFQDKIHCINMGVGKSGKTKLYVHPSASGTTSSYLTQRGLEEDKYQEVEFISIHDVFKNYNIEYCDLLKMDCENSEKDIIRDIDDDLASRIQQISLEFHDKHLVKELVDILSRWYIPENVHRYEWVFRKKK
jgi:FkbM family methyltransferase